VDWPLLIAVLAAATMTLGNLAAFFQTSVKRLLAYSTISQVGYLLMAVAVASRSPLAARSLLFYLAAYAATNLGAFAVVAELPGAATLDSYRGLGRRHPGLAAVLVVCLLGLVGTPPTGVFVGKLEIFTATIDGGYAWLAALAVANTVASLFYYLRWLAPAFLRRPVGGQPEPLRAAGWWAAATAYAAGVVSLGLGIAAGAILPLLNGTLLR
jgi:NADH-quinone oxidoreductase subunit N